MSLIEYRDIYDVQVSKCGKIIGRSGKQISGSDNGRGYLIVTVRIDGKKTSKAIHRLVAEAWIPNPANLGDVNHIDCDKLNNHVSNLEWCTHGENIAYSFTTYNRSALGINNANCVNTEETIKDICQLLSDGHSSAYIRDCGYDYNLVRAIKSKKNWSHISKDYKW